MVTAIWILYLVTLTTSITQRCWWLYQLLLTLSQVSPIGIQAGRLHWGGVINHGASFTEVFHSNGRFQRHSSWLLNSFTTTIFESRSSNTIQSLSYRAGQPGLTGPWIFIAYLWIGCKRYLPRIDSSQWGIIESFLALNYDILDQIITSTPAPFAMCHFLVSSSSNRPTYHLAFCHINWSMAVNEADCDC